MNFLGSPRVFAFPEEVPHLLLREIDLRLDRLEGQYNGPYNPTVSVQAVATPADMPPMDGGDNQYVYVISTGQVFHNEPNPGGPQPRQWVVGTVPGWTP